MSIDLVTRGVDLPPAPGEAEWAEDVMAEYDRAHDRRERERGNQIWKALALAPSVEVCCALLAGESVPVERLDPVGVARLGRRPR
jgi:hypothetical protein